MYSLKMAFAWPAPIGTGAGPIYAWGGGEVLAVKGPGAEKMGPRLRAYSIDGLL
jgi:hypothetical protein